MMRAQGIEPDEVSYATLIKAYKMRGDANGAMTVLELMTKNGVKPVPYIFKSLISCVDDVPKGIHIFNLMEKYACNPEPDIYKSVIALCLRKNDVDAAKEMFRKMLEQGIAPETHIYNMMIGKLYSIT